MLSTEQPPALTERFRRAVEVASEIHGAQRRAGTQIPYLAHLLVVTGRCSWTGETRPRA